MIKLQTALANAPQPNFPTPKVSNSHPSFKGASDDEFDSTDLESHQERLRSLAEDKHLPRFMKGIAKFGVVVFSAVLGYGTMKVGLNKSFEVAGKALKSKPAMKIRDLSMKSLRKTGEYALRAGKYVKDKSVNLFNTVKNAKFVQNIMTKAQERATRLKGTRLSAWGLKKVEQLKNNKYVAKISEKISQALGFVKKSGQEAVDKVKENLTVKNVKEAAVTGIAATSGLATAIEGTELFIGGSDPRCAELLGAEA